MSSSPARACHQPPTLGARLKRCRFECVVVDGAQLVDATFHDADLQPGAVEGDRALLPAGGHGARPRARGTAPCMRAAHMPISTAASIPDRSRFQGRGSGPADVFARDDGVDPAAMQST